MPAVLASASFDSCLGVYSGQDCLELGPALRLAGCRPCGASFGFGGCIVSPFRPTKEEGMHRQSAVRY